MTKNQIKYLRSLKHKKKRKEEGFFLVEGEKMVVEVLASSTHIHQIFATDKFEEKHISLLERLDRKAIVKSTPTQLEQAGQLKSNNAAIALLPIPNYSLTQKVSGLNLLLEDINDPGNLGTIIRIADWYGVDNIFCSENTVDVYNPKTLSATMGSFLRVKIHYGLVGDFLKLFPSQNIYGAFLEGQSIHQADLPRDALLVIGSESHGISDDLASHIPNKITIPRFGEAESLNAAVATAIICDNWKR